MLKFFSSSTGELFNIFLAVCLKSETSEKLQQQPVRLKAIQIPILWLTGWVERRKPTNTVEYFHTFNMHFLTECMQSEQTKQ